MATIYDYLPRYHQVEANNLKALQPGFVVAQMEVAATAKADPDFVTVNTVGTESTYHLENGVICAISADGIIAPTGDEAALFINYTEPLNTILDSPKFYAVNIDEENPRLVQLIPGDEWMTDFEYDLSGALNGRIVEITATSGMSKDDWFKVTTLADGTPAHHYMFLG